MQLERSRNCVEVAQAVSAIPDLAAESNFDDLGITSHRTNACHMQTADVEESCAAVLIGVEKAAFVTAERFFYCSSASQPDSCYAGNCGATKLNPLCSSFLPCIWTSFFNDPHRSADNPFRAYGQQIRSPCSPRIGRSLQVFYINFCIFKIRLVEIFPVIAINFKR